jgi:hypothetical protein
MGQTRTSEYIKGGIRCQGGVNVPFQSVTLVVSLIFSWGKRNILQSNLVDCLVDVVGLKHTRLEYCTDIISFMVPMWVIVYIGDSVAELLRYQSHITRLCTNRQHRFESCPNDAECVGTFVSLLSKGRWSLPRYIL